MSRIIPVRPFGKDLKDLNQSLDESIDTQGVAPSNPSVPSQISLPCFTSVIMQNTGQQVSIDTTIEPKFIPNIKGTEKFYIEIPSEKLIYLRGVLYNGEDWEVFLNLDRFQHDFWSVEEFLEINKKCSPKKPVKVAMYGVASSAFQHAIFKLLWLNREHIGYGNEVENARSMLNVVIGRDANTALSIGHVDNNVGSILHWMKQPDHMMRFQTDPRVGHVYLNNSSNDKLYAALLFDNKPSEVAAVYQWLTHSIDNICNIMEPTVQKGKFIFTIFCSGDQIAIGFYRNDADQCYALGVRAFSESGGSYP